MWLGASDATVSKLDAIDGTFPRGVDKLTLIDTEGVDGDGEGGSGTNNGNAYTKELANGFPTRNTFGSVPMEAAAATAPEA